MHPRKRELNAPHPHKASLIPRSHVHSQGGKESSDIEDPIQTYAY